MEICDSGSKNGYIFCRYFLTMHVRWSCCKLGGSMILVRGGIMLLLLAMRITEDAPDCLFNSTNIS